MRQWRLEYFPSLTFDRLKQGAQKDLSAISPTLAMRRMSSPRYVGGKQVEPGKVELYVHANSLVKALDEGKDVSDYYKLLRLRRNWSALLPESRTDNPDTEFELNPGPTPSRFNNNFEEDFHTAGPWVDAPGYRFPNVADNSGKDRIVEGPNSRLVQEFIVLAGDKEAEWLPHTDFGGLYFMTVVDIRSTEYQVLMSQAVELTEDEVGGAIGRDPGGFPHKTIPPNHPAALKTFPSMLSSGWYDYRGKAR